MADEELIDPASKPVKPPPEMEVGAVVWLKSGSPRLTILSMIVEAPPEGSDIERHMVEAVWMHDGEQRYTTLPKACFTTVRP